MLFFDTGISIASNILIRKGLAWPRSLMISRCLSQSACALTTHSLHNAKLPFLPLSYRLWKRPTPISTWQSPEAFACPTRLVQDPHERTASSSWPEHLLNFLPVISLNELTVFASTGSTWLVLSRLTMTSFSLRQSSLCKTDFMISIWCKALHILTSIVDSIIFYGNLVIDNLFV